jgi:hypothetical protein
MASHDEGCVGHTYLTDTGGDGAREGILGHIQIL